MLRFECTSHTEFENHNEVRFDQAGTPGGQIMIRVAKEVSFDALPPVGSFHELMFRPVDVPNLPQQTGPVDVSSDTLLNQAGGVAGDPGPIPPAPPVDNAHVAEGAEAFSQAGASAVDPDPAAGQAERA